MHERPTPFVRANRRIGVLTFHRCINYGSYWQARSLVEGLRAKGVEAVLLDHASPHVDRLEWRCAMQPLLPRRSPRDDIRLYAAKARAFRRTIAGLPLTAPFPLDQPEMAGQFDTIIVGSDEVWNLSHPWYGHWPAFFGAGLATPTLVAYAASFGNYGAHGGLDDWRAKLLRRFSAISVRDENSRRLINDVVAREPAVVLDPCLQFPTVAVDRDDPEESEFALIYGHSFPDWFADLAVEWAKSRDLRLVSIGYRNDWASEQRLDGGPLEFARLMRNASAVLTNFFHGCVFALLNEKPFACAVSPYRQNKVRDLARLLGADRHLFGERVPVSRLRRAVDEPLSDRIQDNIVSHRSRSDAFLRAVLG